MQKYHLAQINTARALAPMDSDTMKGFVDRLEDINLLADNSHGFVWRMQTEDGDATGIQAFEDPNMLVNISVWESIEALKYFVYKSIHVELIQDRDAWFSKSAEAHQALWWIRAGDTPTVNEAKARLEKLQSNGPAPEAFTFAKNFEPPN